MASERVQNLLQKVHLAQQNVLRARQTIGTGQFTEGRSPRVESGVIPGSSLDLEAMSQSSPENLLKATRRVGQLRRRMDEKIIPNVQKIVDGFEAKATQLGELQEDVTAGYISQEEYQRVEDALFPKVQQKPQVELPQQPQEEPQKSYKEIVAEVDALFTQPSTPSSEPRPPIFRRNPPAQTKAEPDQDQLEAQLATKDFSWIAENPKMEACLKQMPDDTRELMEAVLSDENSRDIFRAVKEFQPKNDTAVKDFTRHLSGALFEQLAYQHIKKGLPKGQILLSPSETFTLWRAIYLNRRSMNNGFGLNKGIEGITVPDGAIAIEEEDQLTIASVEEYKFWTQEIPNTNGFENQRQAYESLHLDIPKRDEATSLKLGQTLNQVNPKIPAKKIVLGSDYEIQYFLPRFSRTGLEQVGYVPVDGSNMHRFIEALFEVLKDDKRLEEKVDKALEALSSQSNDLPDSSPAAVEPEVTDAVAEVTEVQPEAALAQPLVEGEEVAEESKTEQGATEPARPKTQLERRDPKLAENIERVSAEAVDVVRIDGSPMTSIKGAMYEILKECIDKKQINPERRDGDKVYITRLEYALAKYLRTNLRNQALNNKLMADLESLLKEAIAKQEQIKAAQSQNTK